MVDKYSAAPEERYNESGQLIELHPKWVGLTGAETNHIVAKNVGYPERMMKDVENLLKEKNGGLKEREERNERTD
jgi:hypothetical protein